MLTVVALLAGANRAIAGCFDDGKIVMAPSASLSTRNLYPSSGTVYDFRDKPYATNNPVYPVVVRSAPNGVCVTGYRVTGNQSRTLTWRQMKDRYDGDGMLWKPTLGAVTAEQMWMDNVMDALSFPGDGSWTIRSVYARLVRDDCVENDSCRPGLIEDTLVDGAFMFMSQRPGGGADCESRETTIVRKSLVRLQCMPYGDSDNGQPMKSCGPGTGVGQLWKWDQKAGGVVVENSIFLVPSMSVNGASSMDFPPGVYTNVTLVWLGDGGYPTPLPQGVTVTKDLAVWNAARAAWLAAHGCASNGADCPFVHR
jgi:hypothetical protein